MPKPNPILEIIEKLASQGNEFTSDDIRPFLPRGTNVNQIGPAVGLARRLGVIREKRRQPSVIPERKGSLIPVFGAGSLLTKTAASIDADEPEVDRLREYLEKRGYLVGNEELVTLLVLIAARGWTLLAGPSGTGKSLIVRLLAEALRAKFFDVQVKRNWTGSEEVLGYYSEMAREWVPGPLYAALAAAATGENLVFLRFDEMNLAPPEYYVAELLSAGESWTMRDRWVSAAVQLPPMPTTRDALSMTNELFLFGTLNVDETTQPLSAKMLDRSAVITFEAPDLGSLPDAEPNDAIPPPPELPTILDFLRRRPRSTTQFRDEEDLRSLVELGALLESIDRFTEPLRSPIGYRQRDGFFYASSLWRRAQFAQILSRDQVWDACIRAMILPKLQGSVAEAGPLLRGLAGVLAGAPIDGSVADVRAQLTSPRFPRSFDKALNMVERLETLGYFDYW